MLMVYGGGAAAGEVGGSGDANHDIECLVVIGSDRIRS